MPNETNQNDENENEPDPDEQLQNETGGSVDPLDPEHARAAGVQLDQLGTRDLLRRELAAASVPVEPAGVAGEPVADGLGTYADMFEQYRHDQRHWIGPAQLPLVFHIAKLCRKLDANPDSPAALSSSYLQAFHRLERQRPGSKEPAGAGGDLPGQGSIFDELD